jgi:metal-responsive CopG/Arc/MetJ family transcriptional regulator
MDSMTAAAKLKVSLTLSADLIALVDRDARRGKGSRSGVIEQWLRRAANASVQQEIDDATAVYYRSLRDDGTKDEALSRSLSDAARRVAHDDSAPRQRPARR